MQPSRDRRRVGSASPRRRTDRVEDAVAWLLTTAGLGAVALAVLAGVFVHDLVLAGERAAARQRVQVEAVLGADPEPVHVAGGSALRARTARFTDPAGQEREVVVTVNGGGPPGSVVPVWVDRDGRVVGTPLSTVDAAVLGTAAGLAFAAAAVLVLVGVRRAVRWAIDRRNAAAWADEWARVEPGWRRQDR